jgi:hypothetical protein
MVGRDTRRFTKVYYTFALKCPLDSFGTQYNAAKSHSLCVISELYYLLVADAFHHSLLKPVPWKMPSTLRSVSTPLHPSDIGCPGLLTNMR